MPQSAPPIVVPAPKVVSNWRQVLRHAWTVRLAAVATLLSFLEVLLPLIGGSLPFPPIFTAIVIAGCSAGAFIARFVAQKDISNGR